MITADVIDAMVASGCTPEQIAAVVKASLAKRSSGAERQAAYRARLKANKGDGVFADDAAVTKVTNVTSPNVTHDNVTNTDDVVSLSPVPLLSPHTPLITPLPPNPSQKQTARGTRLPDDWQLTGPDLAYALSKGLTEAETGLLGERFSSWAWSASGPNAVKRNWHQAFQGWVQREGPVIIRNRGGPTAKPLTAFQQRRSETQDILNGLDSFAAGSGISSEKDTRLLGHDPGQRSATVRDGSRENADDFPQAGYRTRN